MHGSTVERWSQHTNLATSFVDGNDNWSCLFVEKKPTAIKNTINIKAVIRQVDRYLTAT